MLTKQALNSAHYFLQESAMCTINSCNFNISHQLQSSHFQQPFSSAHCAKTHKLHMSATEYIHYSHILKPFCQCPVPVTFQKSHLSWAHWVLMVTRGIMAGSASDNHCINAATVPRVVQHNVSSTATMQHSRVSE